MSLKFQIIYSLMWIIYFVNLGFFLLQHFILLNLIVVYYNWRQFLASRGDVKLKIHIKNSNFVSSKEVETRFRWASSFIMRWGDIIVMQELQDYDYNSFHCTFSRQPHEHDSIKFLFAGTVSLTPTYLRDISVILIYSA